MVKVTASTQSVKIMCHGSLVDGHLKDTFYCNLIWFVLIKVSCIYVSYFTEGCI